MAGFLGTAVSWAQEPEFPGPSPEHAVLKKDAGSWTAEATMFMPGMPEEKMPGEEVSTMLGEFWVISNYSMDFMGAKFNGQGTFGYDADRKKYIGSWVDSMSPYAMHMEGTWDEAARTMTMLSVGKDPSGVEKKGKLVTVHSEDGNTRVMSMFDLVPDTKEEFVKTMEIKYTKKK
jgi:hypothetical protein